MLEPQRACGPCRFVRAVSSVPWALRSQCATSANGRQKNDAIKAVETQREADKRKALAESRQEVCDVVVRKVAVRRSPSAGLKKR